MYSQLKFEYINSKNQSVDCKASAGERSDVCTSRCWKFFSQPCTKSATASNQKAFEINHLGCCRRWQQILFIPPALRSAAMFGALIWITNECLGRGCVYRTSRSSQRRVNATKNFYFRVFIILLEGRKSFAIGDNLMANIDFKVDDGRRFSAHKVEKIMTRSKSN